MNSVNTTALNIVNSICNKKIKNKIEIKLYGDVEVAFEIENAALHFEVLQMVTALGAEEVLL